MDYEYYDILMTFYDIFRHSLSHFVSAVLFSAALLTTMVSFIVYVHIYQLTSYLNTINGLCFRFWLPILELCVGLDMIMTKRKCACLYATSQAYSLLEASERVFAVHANHKLQTCTDDVSVEDEKKRSLRLGLLGILSGAVIQANADAGFTRRRREEDIRLQDAAEQQRMKYPLDKLQQQNTLELLSISAFL